MKHLIILSILAMFSINLIGQDLIGAWEGHHQSEDGHQIRSVIILSDGYQVITNYDAASGKFMSTNGGTWSLDGNSMIEVVEFDSKNPERVGSEVKFDIWQKESEMGIVGRDQSFKRIDSGTPGALQGAWLMSGRVRDGETQQRDTNRPRKTMKILSGTRFQWIAYNTETKEFKGTGGGNYTTIDGKYTENIEFFSRDDAKAGLSLSFNFELKDGNWHHSGLSSKGDPIHEIWSVRSPMEANVTN